MGSRRKSSNDPELFHAEKDDYKIGFLQIKCLVHLFYNAFTFGIGYVFV